MRNYLTIFIPLLLAACQSGEPAKSTPATEENSILLETSYPDPLQKVLDAHGGLDRWRSMGSLYFEIVREDGNEKHYIQLGDRRDRVEGSNFTMGFDGADVWMQADTAYKGNPEFYHNLMFYFYAMPFVLADPGINYAPASSFQFDGVTYDGLGISYDAGVGSSPKDEYFIYFDPENHKMEWLGYTVTFFSGETSENVKWIRYHDWAEINGIRLPKTITWYQSKDGIPTENSDKPVTFANFKLEKEPFADSLFKGP